MTRRSFLLGSVLAGAGIVAACSGSGSPTGAPVQPTSNAVRRVEQARRRPGGQQVVSARLTPRPIEVDLGGRIVSTWGYDDTLPGPLIRARAGDLLRVEVDNQLPAETSVHWHGLALSNDMDGVPGLTQDPIAPGARFAYEFTVPDPGTYFYHSHSGLQLDRGLYGPLVIDDPNEPGGYDHEWIVVLDDWLDGTGRTPDDVARDLGIGAATGDSGNGGMGGMDHGAMDMDGMDMGEETMLSPLLGGAGDVTYPHFLVGGRVPEDPIVFTATPGQRARIRFINAGADTAFRVALGGHRMTVTHTDGFPVVPQDTDALLLGMGASFPIRLAQAGRSQTHANAGRLHVRHPVGHTSVNADSSPSTLRSAVSL